MISFKKKLLLSAVGAATLMGSAVPVHAANWLFLQGTEKPGQSARARVWGFIQPEYTYTKDTKLQAGPWKGQSAVFNSVRPNLKTNDGFNILRARIGVRGTGFPLDSNVNYFFLAEFGNNGITAQGGGSVKITDASVTLNHLKAARFRVGQFKTPGSEEALQAIHVFDYNNFTNATNQLLLERFFDGNGSIGGLGKPNTPNGPVSAFRDIGIQAFQTFKVNDWEHSYAAMIGGGNGITRGDNDNNKELYLYWASEKVFGGKGPRRKGWKTYVWYQDGKRTLTTGGAGEYDRTRYGLGSTYRKDRVHLNFEYMKADGMIFTGTDGGARPGAVNNAGTTRAGFNLETEGKADGWYVDGGYHITPQWEVDLRYDVLNRMTDVSAKERQFETWTLGTQFFWNKKSRFILNYEFRDAEAPNLASASGPNKILGGMDDRISAQILIVF